MRTVRRIHAAIAAACVSLTLSAAAAAQDPASAREHPYLFFTASELPALRERMNHEPYASRWNALRSAANGHRTRATYGYADTRWALGVAGSCAFAYAMTGDTSYARRAIAEIEALLQAPQWHTGYTWNRGADLKTAEASMAAALVYDWCHDRLSPQQRDAFRSGVLNKSTSVYLQSVYQHNDWWVHNRVSNWSGVCHGGCGLAALAFYDEDPLFAQAADTALDCVADVLDSSILQDGGGHEGIMYHRYGVKFASVLHSAGARVFGDDRGVALRAAEKMAGYWYHYLFGPDQLYANFNNMNESTFQGVYGYDSRRWEGGPPASLCALWESHAPGGDSLLLWGADYGGSSYYWSGVSPFYLLWRRDSPKAPYAMPELRGAVLFRGAGQAVFNTPSLWLAYNGGWTSNRSHNNRDLGTVIVVSAGERLVHDPGYGFAQTGQHSTILVSDSGQPGNVQGTYDAFGSGASFHYLASDLSHCYPLLNRFVRHVLMVRGEYIVILDDLAAAQPERYEWRLQTRAAVSLDGRDALITGTSRRLHVRSLWPAEALVDSGSAAIGYVSITPSQMQTEETLVTLLFPSDMTAEPPAAHYNGNGTLSVGTEQIVFSGGPGLWRLASVGGESAEDIGRMHERTLPSFRGTAGVRDVQSVRQAAGAGVWARVVGRVLVIDAGRAAARVTLLRLDGRTSGSLLADSEGRVSVPAAQLSAGTWIVRVVYPQTAPVSSMVIITR